MPMSTDDTHNQVELQTHRNTWLGGVEMQEQADDGTIGLQREMGWDEAISCQIAESMSV